MREIWSKLKENQLRFYHLVGSKQFQVIPTNHKMQISKNISPKIIQRTATTIIDFAGTTNTFSIFLLKITWKIYFQLLTVVYIQWQQKFHSQKTHQNKHHQFYVRF